MKWHLTQIGAREKYLYPRIINNKGALGSFSTDMWFKDVDSLPLSGKYARLKTRWHPDLNGVNVNSKNFSTLFRILKPYSGNCFDKWVKQGESFGNWAVKKISKSDLSSEDYIFGYSCGSLEVANLAKEKNAKMVLGQCDPAFYWYEVQQREAEKWYKGDSNIFLPSKAFKNRILTEWKLADIIIVNSQHSKEAIQAYGVAEQKIKILPLATALNTKNNIKKKTLKNQKIKILFVGNISFAKGFPYFAEAQKILAKDNRFQFYAIGDIHIPKEVIQKNEWNVTYTGRLNNHDLAEFYNHSHILIFPTLSEGFGQVQLEAMAYGVPVIATRKCGDVVIDGINGKLVETCNSEQIAQAILEIVSDRDYYLQMSNSALETVQRFSFENIERQFWEIFK